MRNKVIIFPTDTVYGIGTSIYNKDGIERIYKIKNRDKSKPLAVLCANLSQINEIAYLEESHIKVINKFLPGSLTIILKAKDVIVDNMKIETVGVRIPNYDLALDILKEVGPMATTSVNESGEKELNDYNIIKEKYNDLVDLIYKPTNQDRTLFASTVIDMSGDLKLIRSGSILFDDIKKILE